MELAHSKVVFKVGCLASLGKFEGDYRLLTLSSMREDTKLTLRGDQSLG